MFDCWDVELAQGSLMCVLLYKVVVIDYSLNNCLINHDIDILDSTHMWNLANNLSILEFVLPFLRRT